MQNQSNEPRNKNLYKFKDVINLPKHVQPYGELWFNSPDKTTDWIHVHDYLEIGRCVKGSGVFNINEEVIRYQSPCISIIYGDMWHSAQSNPFDESSWNFLYIDLQYFLSRVDNLFSNYIKGLKWQNYEFPCIMQSNKYPELSSLIDAIFTESSSVKDGGMENLTALIISLLITHSRLMQKSDKKTLDDKTMERIMPAINYINSNYREQIKIDKLSKLCFISNATLRRDFNTVFELSPSEYLHKIRIKNAATMLVTTQKNILEIALETGYPTLSSFNRQFFSYYKISPSNYRKTKTDKQY